MKKIVIFFIFLFLIFSQCKKDTTNPGPAPEPLPILTPGASSDLFVGAVPGSFTQKVLVEEFTGTWCVACPEGANEIDRFKIDHPGKVLAAAIHVTDVMQISQFDSIEKRFDTVHAVPTCMVNRIAEQGSSYRFFGNDLDMLIKNLLNNDVKAGLAIESHLKADSLTVTVHAGFKEALAGNYYLTIYLVEYNISHDQRNGYNTNPNSVFYRRGDPMPGFKHNFVLRKVLTAAMGDVIPSAKIIAKSEAVFIKKVSVAAYDKSNTEIIAFITKVGATSDKDEVINVQGVKTGEIKNWD